MLCNFLCHLYFFSNMFRMLLVKFKNSCCMLAKRKKGYKHKNQIRKYEIQWPP